MTARELISILNDMNDLDKEILIDIDGDYVNIQDVFEQEEEEIPFILITIEKPRTFSNEKGQIEMNNPTTIRLQLEKLLVQNFQQAWEENKQLNIKEWLEDGFETKESIKDFIWEDIYLDFKQDYFEVLKEIIDNSQIEV